jgi:hypothetical protein
MGAPGSRGVRARTWVSEMGEALPSSCAEPNTNDRGKNVGNSKCNRAFTAVAWTIAADERLNFGNPSPANASSDPT